MIMKRNNLSRRGFIAGAGIILTTGSVTTGWGARKQMSKTTVRFSYCFNTSTIRGQRLSLEKEIEITAKAGYHSIEPWVNKIHEYVKSGGNLEKLRRRINDLGLTVEGAIAFSQWMVDDEAKRTEALEQNKRDMDVLARIGGKRIAAPPAGIRGPVDLMKAAERYRTLLEIGDEMGVIPQIRHKAILFFHLNDYPADPPRETINDRDRIYPGDGIAPLTQIIQDLYANHNGAVLSLELFNPTYWKQDPLKVAKDGLAKMKTAVNKALDTG
jgi:2-keto-myo-inositol isomerase